MLGGVWSERKGFRAATPDRNRRRAFRGAALHIERFPAAWRRALALARRRGGVYHRRALGFRSGRPDRALRRRHRRAVGTGVGQGSDTVGQSGAVDSGLRVVEGRPATARVHQHASRMARQHAWRLLGSGSGERRAQAARRTRRPAVHAHVRQVRARWKRVAYVRDHDLWVESTDGGAPVRLTTDGSATASMAHSDWVYEEEFGERDCFSWSPDGTGSSTFNST